jgi:glycosyltransferase involved in cell wall biosynthesis
MPRVSVVIPTYNRAALIRETLDSVLAQTIGDSEVIVVDDGSTDDTATVIATYGSRVLYLHQENAGQAAARNRGIRAAGAEYIAFVDDDDLWLPAKLEKQLAGLLAHQDSTWAYCDAQVFDGATSQALHNFSQINTPHAGQVAPALLARDFIASPTPVVRRDVFAEVGYFDESALLKRREDWDMWLRIAAHHPIVYLPDVLARYRYHGQNAARAEDPWTVHRSRTAVIERAVSFAPAVYTPAQAQAMAALSLYTGRQFALAGNARDARTMFAQAIHWQPHLAVAYLQWAITLPGPLVLRTIAHATLRARDKKLAAKTTSPDPD